MKFLYLSKKESIFSKMLDKIIRNESAIINGKITFGKKTNNFVKLGANFSAITLQ